MSSQWFAAFVELMASIHAAFSGTVVLIQKDALKPLRVDQVFAPKTVLSQGTIFIFDFTYKHVILESAKSTLKMIAQFSLQTEDNVSNHGDCANLRFSFGSVSNCGF